ncbi:MAG: hypothetical protein J3K34DRAFT_467582 [Monoraphidium minutum]|nr:MAG: hypothetical protein J3K34DRAFT_467582 [Monoraphidium minutum]
MSSSGLAGRLSAARPALPSRAAGLHCRAQQQDEPRGAGNNTDWDAAWARYQKARSPGGSRATTRTAVPNTPRYDPNQKLVLDDIRRQESVLLNLWSSSAFQGGMALFAVVVLVAVATTAGPMPMDDRCTLPWC